MLINENQVFINLELEKKEEVLKFISEKAFEMNIVESQDRLFKELVERENKYPTAVEELIAIPHSKSTNVKEAKLFFIKLKNKIDWDSPDNYQVKVLFVILVPESGAQNEHIAILSKVAVNLLEEDFQNFILKVEDKNEIINYLKENIFN